MAELPDYIKPLFILGLPRSGTTLFQSLLDGHSQLLVGIGDSRFWGGFFKQSKWKANEKRDFLAKTSICHAMNPEGIYYQKLLSHISHEVFFHEYKSYIETSDRSPQQYLKAFYFALGKATEKLGSKTVYWVDKEPASEYFLNKMVKWWPNAKFLHVIRDPRDIYASYKIRDIKKKRKITSVDGFAFWWKKGMCQLEKYERLCGNDRYLSFRYEDLISNLKGIIHDVIAFLGIRDEDILYMPTKGLGLVPWGGNAVTEEKSFEVNIKAAGQWRTVLENSEIEKLESLLHPMMKKYGYCTETGRPGSGMNISGNPKNVVRELKFLLKQF